MLILRKPMGKYGNTFVCHDSTASLNGRIFKNRLYTESLTFELSNSLQNICHSRAFDLRFMHSMTDTNTKKLEFQQLSSRLMKNTNIGQLQMAVHGLGMVGFSKIEFHWKVKELYFLINCKKISGNTSVALRRQFLMDF